MRFRPDLQKIGATGLELSHDSQGNKHITAGGGAKSGAPGDVDEDLTPAAAAYVEPPPIVGTAPNRLRPNAVPFDAIVVRSEFNAPAGSLGAREPVATPSASTRPAIDAAQEEADLQLWLSLPDDARSKRVERIENSVTAHPAPDAGRIITAWRTLSEKQKVEWRKDIRQAARRLTDSEAIPAATPTS